MTIEEARYVRELQRISRMSTCARDCYGHTNQQCREHMALMRATRAELRRIRSLFPRRPLWRRLLRIRAK